MPTFSTGRVMEATHLHLLDKGMVKKFTQWKALLARLTVTNFVLEIATVLVPNW